MTTEYPPLLSNTQDTKVGAGCGRLEERMETDVLDVVKFIESFPVIRSETKMVLETSEIRLSATDGVLR